MEALQQANGIDDPNLIIAGGVLTLPAGTRTEQKGNTGKTPFVGQTQGNDEVGVMERSNEEKIDMLKRSGYTDAQIRGFISEGKLDSIVNYVTQGEFANSEKIGPVPGYPEDGEFSWRGENDQLIIAVVNEFNRRNGYKKGDPGFWTPELLKAQAMLESGSPRHKNIFQNGDVMQVNNKRDWVPMKETLLNIKEGQKLSPSESFVAALGWLKYKGWLHDSGGNESKWKGYYGALRDYNGNGANDRIGFKNHKDWYANTVIDLSSKIKKIK